MSSHSTLPKPTQPHELVDGACDGGHVLHEVCTVLMAAMPLSLQVPDVIPRIVRISM